MVRELNLVSDPILLHIWSSLHNYAYSEALFAAERLYAETRNDESLFVLATSLYKIGRPKQVSKLLNSCKPLTPKCKFLLAKCFYDIGLLADAEDAILSNISNSVDEIADIFEDQSCYVLLLLGDICRRQGRFKDAVKYYKNCLELNPLMWSAFKNLCNIGEYADPKLIFRLSDKVSITTPAYAVVLDDLINSSAKSDCDKISLRENLNPEKSFDILSSTGCENSNQEAVFQLDFESHLNIQRSYVSYCSRSCVSDFDNLKSLITPNGRFPSDLVPKAPKLGVCGNKKDGHEFVKVDMNLDGKNLLCPRFGLLSSLPQSPMFACIPVFSRFNNLNQDSMLSSSVFGLNRCLSTRHHTQDNNLDNHQTNQRVPNLNATNMNSSLSINRHVNFTEKEVNPNISKDQNQIIDKSSTFNPNTTTSTRALRHLVSATTFNLGFLTLDSANNSTPNSVITPPNVRTDPPLLRSAVHRNATPLTPSVGVTQVSPLVSRSNVQFFNSVSQNPDVLSSSSTPRTHIHQLPPSTVSIDIHTSGPRTRSQVAAAAAVARASGIQRRSSRLLRGRGHARKLDFKQLGSLDLTTDQSNLSIDLETTNVCTDDLNKFTVNDSAAFGSSNVCKASFLNHHVVDKTDPRVDSLKQYLELLVQLGKVYQLLACHEWHSATRLLSKLPASQLPTGRILAWAARAHMDNADYQTAHKLFSEAHRREPWQLCGMDFYSTVLWQLQLNEELSELAHDLLELERNAPESWCAVGNCFSLQGEHELAIKFFRRALQVSPTNAYTWTLLGHEQSTLEEYDRALFAFQHALQLDPTHYNALFGLSNVYYKQEKFDLAEIYLNRAVTIFPNSHLLLTNLAALRSRLGRINDGSGSAMDLLDKACSFEPNNPLARYHRASILFHLGHYSDVFSELKKLLVLTPREAMVYLMIGHIYKKLGNTPQAMIHYSWAMELDPKGANTHLRDIMANPVIPDRISNRVVTSQSGTESRLNSFRSTTTNLNDNDSGDRTSATDEDMPNHNAMTHSGMGVVRDSLFNWRDYSLLYGTESLDDDLRTLDTDDHYDTMELSVAHEARNEQTLSDE